MSEEEKMQLKKELRKELDEKYAKAEDSGKDDPDIETVLGEIATELKASRQERLAQEAAAKAAIKPRSAMTKKEKSDYISEHGSAAFLALPAK